MHSHPEAADTLILGAMLYDGTGNPPVERDLPRTAHTGRPARDDHGIDAESHDDAPQRAAA